MAGATESRRGPGIVTWLSRSTLRTLVVSFSLLLLPGFAYVVWLGQRVDLGRRLLVLHLATATLLGTAVLLALALACRLPVLRRRPVARIVAATALTLTGVTLLSIYLGNVVSYRFWNDTLTFHLFRYFVLELHIVRDALPVPALWLYSTLALILLFAALPSVLLVEPLLTMFGRLRGNRSAARIAIVWTLLLAAAIAAAIGLRPHMSLSSDSFRGAQARFQARQLLRREPIVGLFFSDTGFYNFREYWIAIQSAHEAESIRAGYPKDVRFRRRNVVLIISDALRPDHMQVYGYERPTTPFLEGLRASGQLSLVEPALATCPSSPCGISSILASRALASILPQHYALHEVLYDQGYEVQFLLSGDHNFIGLMKFYGDSVTRIVDGAESSTYDATDDRTILEALDATDDYRGVPTFFYFHVMAPHVLAPRYEESRVFLPSDSKLWLQSGGMNPAAHQAAINFYDNGVVQADRTIERIFAVLGAKGYLDNALVVVTSDHGEALGEERRGIYRPKRADEAQRLYGHIAELYQELVTIPLLFWQPEGVELAPVELARQIDVAPTILDWLGLPAPRSWRGTSLLSPPAPTEALMVSYDPEPAYALVRADGSRLYKLIRFSAARWKAREELYELRSDPGERHNLIDQAEDALVADLRKRLDAAIGGEDF